MKLAGTCFPGKCELCKNEVADHGSCVKYPRFPRFGVCICEYKCWIMEKEAAADGDLKKIFHVLLYYWDVVYILWGIK